MVEFTAFIIEHNGAIDYGPTRPDRSNLGLNPEACRSIWVKVTNNLQQVLRAEDTLARMGGDEFVVILSDIGTPEECTLILNRILAAARQTVVLEGHPPSRYRPAWA